MALTIALDAQPSGRTADGSKYHRRGTITFDNSYATGGEAIAKADVDLPVSLDELAVDPTAGFWFEWDKTNGKVKAFTAVGVFTATFDPASLAATTSRDDAITVTGVAATDECVRVEPPAAIAASVVVQGARVTGANTITVRLTNPSAGAVDVASGTWKFYVNKANGAGYEVPNATDLSAVVARFHAEGN